MKKTFLLLMLLFSTYTSAQNFPAPYINPSNIVWSSNSLPSDIKSSSDFLKWSNETGQESASRWGYLSLLDETNSQVIIPKEIVYDVKNGKSTKNETIVTIP
jgi:hypothetical protein